MCGECPLATSHAMAPDRSPTVQSNRELISMTSWAAKKEDEPGMMPGTAEVPHQSAAAHLS